MRDRARELIHVRKMIFFCRLIFQMGFSAGKLCSGELGGEGSRERGDRIQLELLWRQGSSSTVSSKFPPCTHGEHRSTPLQPLRVPRGTGDLAEQHSSRQMLPFWQGKDPICPLLGWRAGVGFPFVSQQSIKFSLELFSSWYCTYHGGQCCDPVISAPV